jgi:hypothetical protein
MSGAERKLATIAFADLVGSTTLVAGRDPEDVRKRSDQTVPERVRIQVDELTPRSEGVCPTTTWFA